MLRRLATFFSNARDLRRFNRLISELAAPESLEQHLRDLQSIWSGDRTRGDALNEFTALLVSRAQIAAVLDRFGYAGPARQEKLVNLYHTLVINGAGQWVGRTYVAAAALYDPELLALLLKREADGANPAAEAFEYLARKKQAPSKINPNDAATYYDRGVAHSRKGQYNRAIDSYSQSISLNPNDYQAFNNRANAYANSGQYRRAIEDWTEAMLLNPDSAQPFYNRANAYLDLGQHEDAIKDYDAAIERNPNFAQAFYCRGIAHANQGQYEDAIRDYDMAIRLDPGDAAAFNNRGVAKREIGDTEGGNADIARARRLAGQTGRR
jgi:tetratricopeptide (TPR) repeat protein